MSTDNNNKYDSSDIFDALRHHTRVKILKILSIEPLSFSEIKRKIGIESSGHLQHHLNKLSGLVSVDEQGKYCLTELGKQALGMIRAIEHSSETNSNVEDKYSNITTSRLSVASIALLALFVILQINSIKNQYFIYLTLASLVFLCIGTFINIKMHLKYPKKKKLIIMLLTAYIIVSSTVILTLSGIPRGGYYYDTYAVPQNGVITLEKKVNVLGTTEYSGEIRQVVYSSSHSVSYIYARTYTSMQDIIYFTIDADVNISGTIYVFLILKPYDLISSAIYRDTIEFNETNRNVGRRVTLILERNGEHSRYEGYSLELMIRVNLIMNKQSIKLPEKINLTVNMEGFEIHIREYVVSSSFQDAACILTVGIFTGFNCYVLALYLIKYYKVNVKFSTKEKRNT
ncbi:MAG: winged helix-turn-helix domain-containing protein [Candidatus Asgardarchaeia archaeon]